MFCVASFFACLTSCIQNSMFRRLGCTIISTQRHFLRLAAVRTITANSNRKRCWKCGHPHQHTATIFCEHCNIIQRPHETANFFILFGIPPQFNVDLARLQKQYRTMQTQLHPDKFANSTDDEKLISAEFSSLVNNAYNTLSNSMARALHMLQLHRESIVENDKSSDSDFLMHIMDLNEAIENASTADEFRLLNERNNVVLTQIEKELGQKFRDNNIIAAKQLVIKMKYYHTMSTKMKEVMGNKGIVD